MLLDNDYTIIPSIKFTLTYDNGVCKVITVKSKDKVSCKYKRDGRMFDITGIVTKIGCNFNSSLGVVGTTAYLQIDGSCEYSGQVEYIQPAQILDIDILETSDTISNPVCSVNNEDQKITLIRENEAGVMQYSLDGLNWRSAVAGSQGMSAYECAVKLGFDGTEEEWITSLQGEDGEPGPAGALQIYRVFKTATEACNRRCEIPKGQLIAVTNEDYENIDTMLFVRTSDDPCTCHCPDGGCDADCHCSDNVNNVDEEYHIDGYKYLGFLTMGPEGKPGNPGEPGKDGKSAYEMAVDGGYAGTENEFIANLARSGIAVTNHYVGLPSKLSNTIPGPMDLRVFGFTNTRMQSKVIEHIDISSPTEPEDQTIIFLNPITLRAVPTDKASARPNITINGRKYVADTLMIKDGVVGVFRRIEYIDRYNGETIIGDWMSSTGELDMGAKVQYTTYGTFEPLDDETQDNYKKLHAYAEETVINVSDEAYISVTYPVNLDKYVNDKIKSKQEKLIPGQNILIDPETNEINCTGGVFKEDFTTTIQVGGLPKGTVIKKGDDISSIMKNILCPFVPLEDRCIFWGTTDNVPMGLGCLHKEIMDDETLLKGVYHEFTSQNQHLVFAYKKSIGLLNSIKDDNGFENIDGWNLATVYDPQYDMEFYIYYSAECLTLKNYRLHFIFNK